MISESRGTGAGPPRAQTGTLRPKVPYSRRRVVDRRHASSGNRSIRFVLEPRKRSVNGITLARELDRAADRAEEPALPTIRAAAPDHAPASEGANWEAIVAADFFTSIFPQLFSPSIRLRELSLDLPELAPQRLRAFIGLPRGLGSLIDGMADRRPGGVATTRQRWRCASRPGVGDRLGALRGRGAASCLT